MHRAATGELPAFARWYEFVRWLLPTTARFPRRLRFTLTQRIDTLALDVIEGLTEARYSRDKLPRLRQINLELERLRILLRLSHDLEALPHRRYEFAVRSVDEVGRMVGGWIRQQEGA